MKDLKDFPKLYLGGARSHRLPPGKAGDVEDGAAGVAGSPVVDPPKLGVAATVACPAASGRHFAASGSNPRSYRTMMELELFCQEAEQSTVIVELTGRLPKWRSEEF